MFIEIKEIGGKKRYYLSHTYRILGKVKKLRRYLGTNLSKDKLDKIRKIAEEQINARIKLHNKIADPLLEIMSEDKIKEIKELELKNNLKVIHLNKEDWINFTGTFAYNTNAIEGSQLSENEVKNILKDNNWPQDKEKEDIAEAQGVAEAIEYIKETKEHISIDLIKEIHKIVFKNSKEYAGKIRQRN
jgi:Fic family protein